jgi:hypothetical protein
MMTHESWESYNPSWLVVLACEQHPQQPWLPDALSQCTRCLRESDAYIYFVNPVNPNEPGSEWQFDTSILLECPTEGLLVLDILKENRVGGVEFVDKIP